MNKNNAVIFKGGKDGIIMILDEAAGFKTIKEVLTDKIRDAYSFFGDAKTAITFKGKELNEAQMMELINIITTETDLTISFVEDMTGPIEISRPVATQNMGHIVPAPRPDIEEIVLLSKMPRMGRKTVHDEDSSTKLIRGNLRSGKGVEHKGSVFLMGDVNAGAEISATGNIIVFGAIKGKVHAGCEGDISCIIAALTMQPIQLRIADKITYFTPEMIKENSKKIDPSYAYIEGEQIYINAVFDK